MTVEEKRRGFQRRSGKDRRSGVDTRSEEEKRRIDERRLAGDTARAATTDEVKQLRREAQDLKEVVSSLPPRGASGLPAGCCGQRLGRRRGRSQCCGQAACFFGRAHRARL